MINVKRMSDRELLEIAIKAAIKGAGEILEVYNADFDVEFKEDKSPLTLADQRSHTAIMDGLSSTGYPVLSEEGKTIPYETRKNWKRFWLVDPLDGTKEFVKKNGEFTVNIALIENGVPIIGVILVPVTGKLYFAGMDEGAFVTTLENLDENAMMHSEKKRIPVPREDSGESYRVVCSRSHLSPETSEYIENLRPRHPKLEFVSIGSSLKLCLIAEGKADLYPRFGPTMEWDTAAGQAIVEISGGFVKESTTHHSLSYNKENLLNPWFIAGRK
jgi:3'(2'), 5'-bisphosphate nucleotidase